eukprot:TRINITY_DN135344_c1_g1_i1.p1 TRINITY_DN135344_c1_g1~~TRINITY_DN135344_c1_g1_i1.p1  ORF type:complete len:596 (-),score=53.28 TRINITY_DN135344_c1_g1_i1:828-2615(-)
MMSACGSLIRKRKAQATSKPIWQKQPKLQQKDANSPIEALLYIRQILVKQITFDNTCINYLAHDTQYQQFVKVKEAVKMQSEDQKAKNAHQWLWEWFNTISDGEATLEYLRVALQKHISKLPQLFSELDPERKNYMTTEDLWGFMRKYKLKATPAHAYCITKLYDSDGDGKVTDEDVRIMIMPTVLRSKRAASDQLGTYGMALLFSMLISKEIDLIDQLSLVADSLAKYGLSAHDIYSCIPTDSGSLTALTLLEYFSKYHTPTTVDSVDLIIRRLDRDKDNKISYLDFMNSLYFHSVLMVEQKTARAAEQDALVEEMLKTPPRRKKPAEDLSGTKLFLRKKALRESKVIEKTPREKLVFDTEPKPLIKKRLMTQENAELLKLLMQRIKALEKEKQELAQRVDFTVDKAWETLAPEKGRKVEIKGLDRKLCQLGVKEESIRNLDALIETVVKGDKQYLTKTDFAEKIISPQKKAYRNLLKTRGESEKKLSERRKKKGLGAHTRKVLAWVLELALENAGNCKNIKEQLQRLGCGEMSKEEVSFMESRTNRQLTYWTIMAGLKAKVTFKCCLRPCQIHRIPIDSIFLLTTLQIIIEYI